MPSSSEDRADRLWRVLICLCLAAFAAAVVYGRQRGIHWGGDDADYALLARALRSFRYDDLFLVGTPPHTTYPPAYPAMLALWGAVFGEGVETATWLNLLFMVGALAILARFVEVHSSTRVAALAVLLACTNPSILVYAGRMLSEAQMIFLGTAAIWFADQRSDRRGAALAIGCAVLCALTRTAGVAVIAGIGGYWLFKRRFGQVLALATVAGVLLGAWFLWTIQDAADPSTTYAARLSAYSQPDVPLWRTVASSLATKAARLLGSDITTALALPLTGETRWDNLAWTPLSLGAVGVGVWVLGRRVPALGLVCLAYGLVLAAWPFPDVRTLVPIIPVLLLAAVVGTHRIGRALHPRAGVPAALVVATILVGFGSREAGGALACDGSVYSRTPECVRDSEVGLGEAITYVDENVPPGAVVMIRRGEVMHYYTGHPTVGWPRISEARSVEADTILARTGADYIVASKAYVGRQSGVAILIENACARLTVEFASLPHTLVLAVHPADSPPSENACGTLREHFPAPPPD